MSVILTCGYGKPDSGCGKQWEYKGSEGVTSCPRCGNRVNTGYPKKQTRSRMATPQNITTNNSNQVRYY